MEEKKEKKVEFLELVYDLIFVYMTGRNNSLIAHLQDGVVPMENFVTYIIATMVVIQIWYFTTIYINVYGRNGWKDHVYIFANMFLLYFLGTGTRPDWQNYQIQYHIAWALILLNTFAQFITELRHDVMIAQRRMIRQISKTILIEAFIAVIAAFVPVVPCVILTAVGIVIGIIGSLRASTVTNLMIDFMHLSERTMLYVVFTFGELVVTLAEYFNGTLDPASFYFEIMTFLVAVGLFMSYEVPYNRLIDRENNQNALGFMFLHVWIVFAVNNITASMELLHHGEADAAPVVIFLVFSIVLYYVMTFEVIRRFSKKNYVCGKNFYLPRILRMAVFVLLMFLFRNHMAVNLLITLLYVFWAFIAIRKFALNGETEITGKA